MWPSLRRAARLKNVPQALPFRFSRKVTTGLVRRFSSEPAERLTSNNVYAEFVGEDAAGLPKENCNGDHELGKGKLNETKSKIPRSPVPKLDHNGNTKLQDKYGPYLFQTILDAPSNSLRTVLDKWIQDGNNLERNEILKTLFHLRKQRLYSKALQFTEWLERGKLLNFEERDYACHLDLIARSRGLENASKYIERVPEPFRNEVLYETLLVNCVCVGNTEKAGEVFKKIRDLSLPLTVSACNQMILLYKRVARRKVVDILMLMEKENIKPSAFTYKLLIDLKGRSNDMAGIELVLNEMKASGFEPDPATLTRVAKFYIRGGLKEKAEAIIKEMEMEYNKDKRHAIRCLLHLYSVLGKPDDMARIWKLCTEPKLEDFLAATEAWGELGHIEQAAKTFEAMQKTSKLSSKYYNAMLNVYAKNKLVAKGKEFVQRMSSDGRPHGPPTWDVLLKLYVNSGEVGKADSFLLNVTEQNPDRRPLYSSYICLLWEYAKRGDVHNSEKIFDRMKKIKYPGRTPPYSVLLEAYVNAKVWPHGFWERMKADNVRPIKKVTEHLKFLHKFQEVGI